MTDLKTRINNIYALDRKRKEALAKAHEADFALNRDYYRKEYCRINANFRDKAPEMVDIIRSLEAKVEEREAYITKGATRTQFEMAKEITKLQTKLTEQDKLLEVMGEAIEKGQAAIDSDKGYCNAAIALNKARLQYQSYKAGRE